MKVLREYDWPGNVRELENICQRASVLATEEDIRSVLIHPWLVSDRRTNQDPSAYRPGHILEDLEREMIERILLRFNGHREKTARALGIGVRTLGMKLKRWREEARQAG